MLKHIPCGPSMTDCLEISGNLQKPAGNLRGRFILLKFYRKPVANLPRFPEVSGQSDIDGPNGMYVLRRAQRRRLTQIVRA